MSKPRIQLSDHFTYPRLLRFVAPRFRVVEPRAVVVVFEVGQVR